MVLAHEMLLLVHNRCRRKRGGGQGPCHTGVQPLDSLPAFSTDTIECAAHSAKDTIALECLVWAVYDNQLGPGKSLSLSGMESYGQVLQCLVDKVFQGLQACCPVCKSAMFKLIEKEKVKSVVMVPQKPQWPERHSMMRDMRKEFVRGDQVARGWEQPLDPEVDTMRWMKEHQHSCMDAQLDFWLLLRPLTDSGEELSRHLVRRLLSIWHWASALDPPVWLPVPSALDIGHWLQEDRDVDDRQWWIKAYECSLQRMAEASVGQYWTMVGETMVPEVSNLVKTFMTATGMQIPPHVIRQCWPLPWEGTPQQDLGGICEVVIHKLDEVATRCPSTTAWDRFTFLPEEEKHW